MFSLKDVPSTLPSGIPPDAFDPTSATPLARELASAAPYPTPGSPSDNRLADQVERRFAEIEGATVSEQRFDGSFKGHHVDMRNLIATLPGESEPRDRADRAAGCSTGQRGDDRRSSDRRAARDRGQLLGLLPPEDPRLRLHRRREHRRARSEALHRRLQRRGPPRCGDRPQPTGPGASHSAARHPVVHRTAEHGQPTRRDRELDGVERAGDARRRRGTPG